MPNGVSCAYFAIKNHETGKKDNNIFREGIAGIQGVRTLNAVAGLATPVAINSACNRLSGHLPENSAAITVLKNTKDSMKSIQNFLSSASNAGKKIVYPLIIASGILNTVRAEDKVKKGASEAAGIGVMYLFEVAAEKLLSKIPVKNKYMQMPVALFKGCAFICASLAGYNAGSGAANKIVDKIRSLKESKKTNDNCESRNNSPNLFSKMEL